MESNKLLLQLIGPFQALKRMGANNDAIYFNRKRKIFHFTMQKRFYSRNEEQYTFDVGSVVATYNEDTGNSKQISGNVALWVRPIYKKETYLTVNVSEYLSLDYKQELWDLLKNISANILINAQSLQYVDWQVYT